MDKNNIEKLFDIADKNLLCNTSYPLYPEMFQTYKVKEDVFAEEETMSFYIHIPFCKQMCKFCEYTRFVEGNYGEYLDKLEVEIKEYLAKHKNTKYINGLDIGGGTPSALDLKNFQRLMDIQKRLQSNFTKTSDFEKSIEISIQTIDEDKLRAIADGGFKRISTGIQVMNTKILNENNRPVSSISNIIEINNIAKKLGIEKLNLDLMYGMLNQSNETLIASVKAIALINPEHVTLYETRFNMNGLNCSKISREKQYEQYEILYDELIKIGYTARFGQNVFTRIADRGVSSYLYHRMNDCVAYKGFGISAQSMSKKNISYNILKNRSSYKLLQIDKIETEDNYLLPKEEILAKYISISLYNGRVNKKTCDNILKADFIETFKEQIEYLSEKKYIDIDENYITLTRLGFRYYGAISSLFWSQKQIEKLEECK